MCWTSEPSGLVRADSGKRCSCGHRTQVVEARRAEQDHRPPLLDGEVTVGIDLLEVHHHLGAGPDGAHRREFRPRVERLAGS
jgi:hypothetical protein